MTKLFEDEVGNTLRSLGGRCFYLKPIDGVMWAAERVDFHAIIDGRGVNIEAKEIKSTETFNLATQVTPNQLNCLLSTTAAGGIGVLAVNFGRLRGPLSTDRARGFMALFIVTPELVSLARLNKNRLKPDNAFESVFPLSGGLWETGWITRMLSWQMGEVNDG